MGYIPYDGTARGLAGRLSYPCKWQTPAATNFFQRAREPPRVKTNVSPSTRKCSNRNRIEKFNVELSPLIISYHGNSIISSGSTFFPFSYRSTEGWYQPSRLLLRCIIKTKKNSLPRFSEDDRCSHVCTVALAYSLPNILVIQHLTLTIPPRWPWSLLSGLWQPPTLDPTDEQGICESTILLKLERVNSRHNPSEMITYISELIGPDMHHTDMDLAVGRIQYARKRHFPTNLVCFRILRLLRHQIGGYQYHIPSASELMWLQRWLGCNK